jgi:hypothetical protein
MVSQGLNIGGPVHDAPVGLDVRSGYICRSGRLEGWCSPYALDLSCVNASGGTLGPTNHVVQLASVPPLALTHDKSKAYGEHQPSSRPGGLVLTICLGFIVCQC